MEDYKLLRMLLTMFLTSALGVIIYCGIFSYSFQRKNKFVLRLCLSLFVAIGITGGMGFGLYYGFTHGIETSLKNIECIRIASNLISLLLGVGTLFVCFKETPSLILFATIMGYASNGLGTNIYEMITEAAGIESLYFTLYDGYSSWTIYTAWSYAIFVAAHFVVFFALYYTCARAFAKTAKTVDKQISKSIIWMFAIFIFVTIGVEGSNVFNSEYNGATLDAVSFTYHGIVAWLYVVIIFALRFILVWAHTAQEKESEKAFYEGYREKVEEQERNMELINLKCHDMKHQLRSLLEGQNLDEEFIQETQNAISIYDAQVKTGNDALDTLLTRKSLVCEAKKIQLTVMLDGGALSFMTVQEINSFFGNAIDNAVEYLLTVDEDNRILRISSSQNGSMLIIRVENYCDAELSFRSNGLPATTKGDEGYHGFGTKSIRAIAQKYGGDASFVRQDDLFILTAIFML